MNEAFLQKQIGRLKVLPRGEDRPWGTEQEQGLKHELFKQLWRMSSNDKHAQMTVDECIETCKFCPSPAELTDISESIRVKLETEYKPNWGPVGELCADCGVYGAFGWIIRNGRYEECPQCSEIPTVQKYLAILLPIMNGRHNRPRHFESSKSVAGRIFG